MQPFRTWLETLRCYYSAIAQEGENLRYRHTTTRTRTHESDRQISLGDNWDTDSTGKGYNGGSSCPFEGRIAANWLKQ